MRNALLIATLALVVGCKKFPDLGGVKLSDYMPKVAFDRLRVDRVDFGGVDAVFVLNVENPAPVDLRLASFEYDLALEGLDFLDGRSDDGFALSARDTSKLRIPASIGFADVFALVGDLRGKDEIGFGLKGKLGVNTPLGPLDVPFDEQGRLPTLQAPKIEPKAVRIGQINLLQNRASVEIDLAVTNRAKAAAYGMKDFAYGIDLGGRRVIDGNLADLSVAAGATETRTIPVNLNLLELGTTIVTSLQQKRPLDVRLDAGLGVDTPLGVIPLRVDELVSLRPQ